MDLALQLALLKTRQKMTTEQLSRLSGVPIGTINKVLNGETRNPTSKTLGKLAHALGTTVEALYGDERGGGQGRVTETLLSRRQVLPITTRRLPLLGEISCGEPRYAEADSDCYVLVGDDINADFVLRAKGDSMIGANIHDGYLVFIRKQSTVDSGEIAAVVIDEDTTLKRVYWLRDGTLELRAENPRYPPIHLGGEDEINSIFILGKAVAFQGEVV